MKLTPEAKNQRGFKDQRRIKKRRSDSAKAKKGESALENTLLKLGFREKKFVRLTFGGFNRPNR